MILTKTKTTKKKEKTKKAYEAVDEFCFNAKNLKNYTNYIIKQCSRISKKMADNERLEQWEAELVDDINKGIKEYNDTRQAKRPGKTVKRIKAINKENSFIADAYFLSWYLKAFDVYKKLPSSSCAQGCIQAVCREWKAFYKSLKAYQKDPSRFLGRPKPPKYLDKENGRYWLIFTKASFKVTDDGFIQLPKTMPEIKIKASIKNIQQVRIFVTKTAIKIHLLHKVEEQKPHNSKNIMGIDTGVNNLAALAFSNKAHPYIINGRPLKSINQFYNKEKARLQSLAQTLNNRHFTNRMERLNQKRNNKVNDYLHKASRLVINLAIENNIGTIVIGHNKNQKQGSNIGKMNNQSFVSIPFNTFIQMIEYKAKLAGIKVIVTEEAHTSGTSYLDKELPNKENYNKKRRVKRGLFISNSGEAINADVNAAYQIIKKFDESRFTKRVKHQETVIKQVA